MSEWLGADPLTGSGITLRPCTPDDAPALAQVIGDPARFRWVVGVPTDEATARRWIDTALADPRRRAYVVVDGGGSIVGSTSYYDIDKPNLAVAIGYTFYAESVQGTAVNPAAKYLLLANAFDDHGAVRVVWHTHEANAQSRSAIAKLGATFEGLLRKHRRFGDGWRTTAQYAMTDDDWPAARERLRERLA